MATVLPPSLELKHCLAACRDCREVCLETLAYCQQQGGRHAEASHLAMLRECAETCAANAAFITEQGRHDAQLCAACVEICRKCAEECDSFGPDEQMQKCASVCRQCAEACRLMM